MDKGRHGGSQKSDSFLDTKGGPILYVVLCVVGLWFLLWFANV